MSCTPDDCQPGSPADRNYLSALQYSVDRLGMNHVIPRGHTGCGGVLAALGDVDNGYVRDWIQAIRLGDRSRQADRSSPENPMEKANGPAELNVKQPVSNISQTSIIRNVWNMGRMFKFTD